MTFNDFIYKFTGDDYRLIKLCSAATRNWFLVIGLLMLVIFLLCCISSYFVFNEVFHKHVTGVSFSLFFSLVITNIYLLLLYTLTKNVLIEGQNSPGVYRSIVIRVTFVCFISLIVSKPLESIIYKGQLDRDIKAYREETEKKNYQRVLIYYREQMKEVESISNDPVFIQRFIADKQQNISKIRRNIHYSVASSSFYFQRLRFLNSKHPSCWLISVLVMFLFLLPVYIKYRNIGEEYYSMKREYEKRKVDLAYYAFKKRYAGIFEKKYQRKIAFCELYEDAPYNTIRKKDKRRFLKQENLLSELYHVGA